MLDEENIKLNVSNGKWSVEALQIIARMSRERAEIKKIASAVNAIRPDTSVNAVISKRAWLRKQGHLDEGTKGNSDKAVKRRGKSIDYEQISQDEMLRKKPSFHEGNFSVAPRYRKRLFELQDDQCRWPYGDVKKPGFHFCCLSSEKGTSYCATHLARATKKV